MGYDVVHGSVDLPLFACESLKGLPHGFAPILWRRDRDVGLARNGGVSSKLDLMTVLVAQVL